MQIKEYIRTKILQPRLQESGCLVVFDADRRYRELTRELASEDVTVIDASESSIESREAASRALRELAARGGDARVVVYVPSRKPVTDEQKQLNPFSLYEACGAVFPKDDDSDEYQSLCVSAKPEYASEIRQKFAENPSPAFAIIDAIGGGNRWPQLRTILRAESANDILTAILAPYEEQKQQLKGGEGWLEELRDLLQSVLGMKLVTKAKQRDSIAHEVWRFLLFSEFVFDLPGTLPPNLTNVPKAPDVARIAVETLCDALRKHSDHRQQYIERAAEAEKELHLPEECQGIADLGSRDTFPFEERTFLLRAAAAIRAGQLEAAEKLVARSKQSVWSQRDENVEQWDLVNAALRLVEICGDLEPSIGKEARTLESLVAFFTSSLRIADRAHRALERASLSDVPDSLEGLVSYARKQYRDLAERVQTSFLKHVEQNGWPVTGLLENAAVFDKVIEPMLAEKGRRVGMIVVDALRYELAGELAKEILGGEIDLQAACATLPTITPVGMASLLPGAASGLDLKLDGDTLTPYLGGIPVKGVPQRMDVLQKRFGDRFHQMTLSELQKKKPSIPATVDLLVIRTTEIDSMLENDAYYGVKLIPTLLKDLTTAIAKVRALGFRDVVVVTDHGFALNAAADVGDLCPKPATGAWKAVHDRMVVGEGDGDIHNFSIPVSKLGVRASFSKMGGPRSMAPYRAGVLFFHGGLSLQEAIVPVLKIRFAQAVQALDSPVEVTIVRKGGASRKVTSRLPVFVVSAAKGDMFSSDQTVELRIDAVDREGRVVGEPRQGEGVDPSTNTITLSTGSSRDITLRMTEEFEGKFQVRVLNPATMTAYDSLDLETSYNV